MVLEMPKKGIFFLRNSSTNISLAAFTIIGVEGNSKILFFNFMSGKISLLTSLNFRLLVILSFFLLFFSALRAEVVKNVTIEGNKRISDETIKIYGEVELNKNFNESDLNKVVSNLNSTNFFPTKELV